VIATLQGGIRPIQFVQSLSPVAWYRRGVGMSVSAWVDQVAGANFVQATATNQPTVTANGSLLFDGVDNYMTATVSLPQPYTIYGLVNTVTWTANDRLMGAAGNAAAIFQAGTTPTIRFFSGATITGISPVLNTVNVISVVGNGASSVLQLNNDTPITGDAGAGAFTNPFLASTDGTSQWGNTDNYEWIFYGAAHDDATRARVISYLMSVGGI
jgi:hypothetical protein